MPLWSSNQVVRTVTSLIFPTELGFCLSEKELLLTLGTGLNEI